MSRKKSEKQKMNSLMMKYIDKGNFYNAGQIAERLGMKKKAKELYMKEIENCLMYGDYATARLIAKKIGLKLRTNW
ncbi:MAG: hypothetical protein QXL14_04060 [Candidatus Aenigmatarchaeota archaeon]